MYRKGNIRGPFYFKSLCMTYEFSENLLLPLQDYHLRWQDKNQKIQNLS